MKHRILRNFLLISLAAWGSAQAQLVSIASLPAGSLLNSQSQALAKVIQDKTDLKLRVTTYSGDIGVYDALHNGEADFAIDSIHVAAAATNGFEVFEGRPRNNVALMTRLFPFYSGIFVKKDSPITSIAQLKGQKMPVSYSAHVALVSISKGLLAAGGLTWNDIEGIPAVNVIRSGDDFAAGRVAAIPFGLGAPKVTEVAASVGGIRFLPIPQAPEAVKALRAIRPNDDVVVVNPGPNRLGVDVPTALMASDLTLVVGSHVKPEVIAKVLKALHDNKAALAAGHPSFNTFEPENMYKQYNLIKYHAGAVKYFTDNNMPMRARSN